MSPGTVISRILDAASGDFASLQYLRLTGRADTMELKNIKRFSELKKVDLGKLDIIGKVIPGSMFYGLDSLREVVFPADVTEIKDRVFVGCYNLEKVTFPETSQVHTVGYFAFADLYHLEEAYMPNIKYVHGRSFHACKKLDLSYLRGVHIDNWYDFSGSGITEVPEGFFADDVTDLRGAFWDCHNLKSLYIPDSAVNIDNICNRCENLESVRIGESVKTIRDNAFYGTALREIVLPESVLEITGNIFYDCPQLRTIKCEAILPPTFTNFSPSGAGNTDFSKIKVHVPRAAADAYARRTDGWGKIPLVADLDVVVDRIKLYDAQDMYLDPQFDDIYGDNIEMTLCAEGGERRTAHNRRTGLAAP